MRTLFTLLVGASSLAIAACATTSTGSYMAPTEFEGGTIQAMQDAYGAPVQIEPTADGEERAWFVFSDRIVARGSTGANAIWKTRTPSSAIHPGHRGPGGVSATTPRFVSITCQVEARYDAEGTVSSVVAEPSRCERLRRRVPVPAAGDAERT